MRNLARVTHQAWRSLWCKHTNVWAENAFARYIAKLPKREGGKMGWDYEYMGLVSYCPDCGWSEFIPETEKWGAK